MLMQVEEDDDEDAAKANLADMLADSEADEE